MREGGIYAGQSCYSLGDAETRSWFERQWGMWPIRADERLTTNVSFHYGGVVAFRMEHNKEPQMSRDFRSHVDWHDRHPTPDDHPNDGGKR